MAANDDDWLEEEAEDFLHGDQDQTMQTNTGQNVNRERKHPRIDKSKSKRDFHDIIDSTARVLNNNGDIYSTSSYQAWRLGWTCSWALRCSTSFVGVRQSKVNLQFAATSAAWKANSGWAVIVHGRSPVVRAGAERREVVRWRMDWRPLWLAPVVLSDTRKKKRNKSNH